MISRATVALEDRLNLARDLVVLLAHDHRVEHARGGVQRVDGRIDALSREIARSVRRRRGM